MLAVGTWALRLGLLLLSQHVGHKPSVGPDQIAADQLGPAAQRPAFADHPAYKLAHAVVLGDVSPVGHSAMLNLIGIIPPRAVDLGSDMAWLHDYGKAPRPGRKLGHITIVADRPAIRDREMARIRALLCE